MKITTNLSATSKNQLKPIKTNKILCKTNKTHTQQWKPLKTYLERIKTSKNQSKPITTYAKPINTNQTNENNWIPIRNP